MRQKLECASKTQARAIRWSSSSISAQEILTQNLCAKRPEAQKPVTHVGDADRGEEKRPQRWTCGLRVHGPHAFERFPASATIFRYALPAGAEGALRPQPRSRQGLRRKLGIPVRRIRLAQTRRAERYRSY